MYRIAKGQKILNVKISDQEYKSFYEGDILPESYVIPESYFTNNIVELAEIESKSVKRRLDIQKKDGE